MAVVEGATQGLIAAFTFGIVVNAASAALFLYTKGHGSSIFRDSQRLALILFLLCAALWAQLDFVTVLLDISTSSMPCQVGVIFATVFDQLGRFSIEQYLVWAINNGEKLTVWQMLPQAMVLARFVAGAVFSGFTRPQMDTFCVAMTSAFPVAVVVIVLDVVILLLLTSRMFSSSSGTLVQNKESELARRVSLKLVLLGLAIWTASSVALLLGIRTVDLVARTAVPAIGLTILIIIVTGCAGTLGSTRGATSRRPEAPSPRRINISRDVSTSDSDYPPTRYEDLKEAAIRSSTTFINPREVPRFKDESSAGPPFMAGLPSVKQAEVLPPPPAPPANVAPAPTRVQGLERSASQKRGFFGFGKPAPSISVNKVMISNPILQDNAAQNPLNKIATIGLEEAAMAERARRARMQEPPQVPQRPTTQMNMSPDEVMRRGMSVKRKEVASMTSQSGGPPVSLQPEITASTTAAQLSPGVEEIRRRSPRQPTQEQMPSLPQPIEPARVAQPAQAEPVLEARAQPFFAQQPVARLEIRPSRQAPPSPKAPPPEPEKTALQRRPTIGLPTNPKARALKVAQEASAQQQQLQTVMFVNNIVYDDPTAVRDIIKGANDRAAMNAAATESEASVVNRPRPVPRKADSLPQPSPSPKHKRTKSGGSMSRKSILTSAAGSPTQLPPLPPPPMGMGISIRPNPNDTKSMTVDEKMTMFFPNPPSGNGGKRGSPVPALPPIPVSYLDTSSSPTETDLRRGSNRTTKTSFKTDSILDVDEIPRNKPDQTSRFSPMTEMNLADEVGNSWLPGIPTDNRSTGSVAKRASSSVMAPGMLTRSSAWTENTDARTDDDVTTNWGTVHSPELAVGIQVMKKSAQPSTIRKADHRAPIAPKKQAAVENTTFKLDELRFDSQDSWLLETEPEVKVPERTSPSPSQWHRRVGDECPTFSAREKTRSRKMPPPRALMLNGIASKNKIIIQAEPSPLESPEHALQEIQAQLKKLENSNRNSLESPSHRLALLENLEREMGLQEDHWQEMKHDIGRDSLTSVQTASPTRNYRAEPAVQLTREPPTKQNIAIERRASRRARMRSNSVTKPAEESPEMVRPTNGWQKRLTEAQTEYMEAAAELLRTRNGNLLTVSKSQLGQLGSPTPPDSDQSDEELPRMPNRLNAMLQPPKPPNRSVSLWKPTQSSPPTSRSLLWIHVKKAAPEQAALLPGLTVRPALRKVSAPLQIHSSWLWQHPYTDDTHTGGGLWRPSWESGASPSVNSSRFSNQGIPESQKAPRPLTQRPPRRSKRMTLLPDILESPEPLPDKRGTLGIFQFPWGERSDTASIQSSRPTMYMAMPGTMSSGGPSLNAAHEHRAKQLESAEYASSFFDDYDDDDDAQNSDEENGESDDGFDETTLWEIASLLKSDAVPSKSSLLPGSSSSAMEEYMDDIPSDDESGRSSREQSIVIGLGDPRDVMFEQPRQLNVGGSQQQAKPKGRSQAIIIDDETSAFWTLDEEYEAEAAVPALKPTVFGLPSNPKASRIPRAAPPATAALPLPPLPPSQPSKASQLPRLQGDTKRAGKATTEGLWAADAPSDKSSAGEGMYVPNANRSDYRTTTEEPAAKATNRRSRLAEAKSLETVASTGLWTTKAQQQQKSETSWLSRASSQPASAHRKRIAATPAQWDAALHEAIRASLFNPAVRHPVFFPAASLVTRTECFHPAATGYTHDPAAVHPVFFGSLTVTCPREAVHPAFAAQVCKKMRRQRSKVSTRERPASRGRALSRPDGTSSVSSVTPNQRRKDEIHAQIRVLEQQKEYEEVEEVEEVEALPQQQQQQQQLPAAAAAQAKAIMSRRDAIMAQIEALEQEKLFVQLAAQEEYRRRTSLTFGSFSTEEPSQRSSWSEDVLLSAAEIVAQQQRRMSQVWRPVIPAPGRTVPVVLSKGLWAPASSPSGQEETVEAAGLWTPGSESSRVSRLEAGEDDAEARARRARGRAARMELAMAAEILAQIANIEAEVDPMAEYKRQKMWRPRPSRVGGKRSWLHERKPSRVALRY